MRKHCLLVFVFSVAPAAMALACGGGTKSLNQTATAIFSLDDGRAILENLGGVNSLTGVAASTLFGITYTVSESFLREENIGPLTNVQTNVRQSIEDPAMTATGKIPNTRAEISLHEIDRAFAELK